MKYDLDVSGAMPLAVPHAEGVFALEANMEGVEARLPQVKIVHQGCLYMMPDGTTIKHIEGTVIDTNVCRAWWKKTATETGGGEPPDCASADAVTPNWGDNRQADTCASCPHTKWGSDRKGGRGQDCKCMRRTHWLLDTMPLPLRLTLPPSSLRPWDDYITKKLLVKRLPYPCVITRATLLARTDPHSGQPYSQALFDFVADTDGKPMLTADDADGMRKLKGLIDRWRPIMRGQPVEVSEYQAPEV